MRTVSFQSSVFIGWGLSQPMQQIHAACGLQEPSEVGSPCTSRRRYAHRIEEREVLYPPRWLATSRRKIAIFWNRRWSRRKAKPPQYWAGAVRWDRWELYTLRADCRSMA